MRRAGRWIGLLAVVAALLALPGCGDDDDEAASEDRFGAIPKRTIEAPENETAPRWQKVADIEGSEDATQRVAISRGALQWRVRWRCRSGDITIAVTPPPANSDGRASGSCPARDEVIWVGAGTYTVDVRASAPFRVIVDEEVRTPLHEPAPAAVRTGRARELARGRFAPIEFKGAGRAVLYRMPNGRLTLRMEDFRTEPNPQLTVWLSESANPTSTRRIFRAPHTTVRSLKSTIGDQNYMLPAGTDAEKIRSVVVVNASQRIAYAVARLNR